MEKNNFFPNELIFNFNLSDRNRISFLQSGFVIIYRIYTAFLSKNEEKEKFYIVIYHVNPRVANYSSLSFLKDTKTEY